MITLHWGIIALIASVAFTMGLLVVTTTNYPDEAEWRAKWGRMSPAERLAYLSGAGFPVLVFGCVYAVFLTVIVRFLQWFTSLLVFARA